VYPTCLEYTQEILISVQNLKERTQSYLDAGLEVIWAFDHPASQGQGWASAHANWLRLEGHAVIVAEIRHETDMEDWGEVRIPR
jgi:hypothetical protein